MNSNAATSRRVRWDATLSRGMTEDGHSVAVLRNRSEKILMVHVKMPPGQIVTDLYRPALSAEDCVTQAEDLVLWPNIAR